MNVRIATAGGFRTCAALSIALALTACATRTPLLPENYAGPTAILKDSAEMLTMSKADMYYATNINAVDVNNVRSATQGASQGRGALMLLQKVERRIPATPLKVQVVARTAYAMPIMAMTGTVYQVKGEIDFTPEPDKNYVVRGKLGPTYSAVWIEEEASSTLVGKKIEVNGSAELGFFDK
ncbi:hypothetical protein I5R65_18680 [Herbaspirillum sp. AP02]|uniref:hypothetical protein n=1 Tax=unclassified Herbaspirillum TaxID=2624150 RepID=UPI0015DA1607|nr:MULTISPECIES: hypothetical protein [unclassified Herbaspirillum]MBG7621498.1 hypothetical protein [Herbaspirillum sp. AP02]NZD69585.1 hypothetical protein [Herbaspirillum sp. AP21]